MDILCRSCQEPWEAYYLRHELTPDNYAYEFPELPLPDGTNTVYDAVVKGKGCPACKWGTVCPICSGRGVETWALCRECGTKRVFRPSESSPHEWYHSPSGSNAMRTYPGHTKRHSELLSCFRCGGSGNLPKPSPDEDMEFLRSVEDSTDGHEIFDAIDSLMAGGA